MNYETPQFSTDELFAYIHKNRLLRSGADNVKLAKSSGRGYMTYNLSLMPWKYSGFQMCAMGADCHADCIGHKSGNNVFKTTQIAKIKRTQSLMKIRDEFVKVLQSDIESAKILASENGLLLAVRLNTYSDFQWEDLTTIIQDNPTVQFYDYTKLGSRLINPIRNYSLTYSLSDHRHSRADIERRSQHYRCALVVSRDVWKQVHKQYFEDSEMFLWNGIRYYNGDIHDLTFLHPQNGVLILKEKYKKTPEQPNPLVYRSLDSIGLS